MIRLRTAEWCSSRNFCTGVRSSGVFNATLTNSKSRLRYQRYVVNSSGYSVWHGPHHVAQKLIINVLPVELARSFFNPSSETVSSVTGFAIHSFISLCLPAMAAFHFVLHPNTG